MPTMLHGTDNDKVAPEDDWFAEAGDVALFDEEQGARRGADEQRSRAPEPDGAVASRGVAPSRAPSVAHRPAHTSHDAAVHRRRVAAVAAIAVLVGVAIAIPLVLLSGGGGTASPPVPQVPTTAATTTTPVQPAPVEQPSTTSTAPAALTVALPDGKSMRAGDRGAAVTTLQKALVALAYDPGTPDGVFGSNTTSAVVAFQTDKGLDPDGVVGSKTVEALNAALAAGRG